GSRPPGASARTRGTVRPAPRRTGARRRIRVRGPRGGRRRRGWALAWTAAIQAPEPGGRGGLLLSALRAQPAPGAHVPPPDPVPPRDPAAAGDRPVDFRLRADQGHVQGRERKRRR